MAVKSPLKLIISPETKVNAELQSQLCNELCLMVVLGEGHFKVKRADGIAFVWQGDRGPDGPRGPRGQQGIGIKGEKVGCK